MRSQPEVVAIHDTEHNVVHVPDLFLYSKQLENVHEFVQWLNTKAKKPRFVTVTAIVLPHTSNAGMNRRYAEYLKGEPQVRIRLAIKKLTSGDSIRLHHHGGAWLLPNVPNLINAIAAEAKVPFNDARQALYDYLHAELGNLMDRIAFPPVDAVRDPDQDDPYPVDV